MNEYVYPNENLPRADRRGRQSLETPPIMDELKGEANRGLWNLFLPESEWRGLST